MNAVINKPEISLKERESRQTAMNHAVASNRLEGLILPPEALRIMQSYVEGEITYEQEEELMIALAKNALAGTSALIK